MLLISIHAPAGGATEEQRPAKAHRNISIHAPAGGATAHRTAGNSTSTIFQFTPLREGRLYALAQTKGLKISIHAPAGGATDE